MPRSSRARRSSRRRRAQFGAVSGLWFAVAAAFTTIGILIESLSLIVAAVLALVAAVVSLFAGQAVAVPAVRRPAAKASSGAGNRGARGSSGRGGTRPVKPKRCGARCRRSTKPASTCDCSCRGRSHGSEVGRTFDGSRAALRTPAAKKAERAAVRREREARRG